MCNILIYFYNIHMKHLQHISEIYETLETYASLQHALSTQCNISMLLGRMEARRCVDFIGGNGGCVTQQGGHGKEVAPA
jgi:FtsZ-interacting cell division protein YlmF